MGVMQDRVYQSPVRDMVDLRQRFADTRNDLAVLLWRNGLQGRVQQWIDPLVRAMCIDPPLDALERSTKKIKNGKLLQENFVSNLKRN